MDKKRPIPHIKKVIKESREFYNFNSFYYGVNDLEKATMKDFQKY